MSKLAGYIKSNKLIAGSVVTGIVAVGAIAGVLAWSNTSSTAEQPKDAAQTQTEKKATEQKPKEQASEQTAAAANAGDTAVLGQAAVAQQSTPIQAQTANITTPPAAPQQPAEQPVTPPTPPATQPDPVGNPDEFDRPIVSLTFDDGWLNIAENGLPVLDARNLKSTQYVNSEPIENGWEGYMTYQNVADFTANGHELAWHTRTHADLTTLTEEQRRVELTAPDSFLASIGAVKSDVVSFATPYGSYDVPTIDSIMDQSTTDYRFTSHRSVDEGYNAKSDINTANGYTKLNPANIKVQNILDSTTPAEVQAWIDNAIASKTWLVIVYHEVLEAADTNPAEDYSVTVEDLTAEMDYLNQQVNNGAVDVQTVRDAINTLLPQL